MLVAGGAILIAAGPIAYWHGAHRDTNNVAATPVQIAATIATVTKTPKSATTQPTANSKPKSKVGPEMVILGQLKDGTPDERQRAVDSLKHMVSSSPDALVQDMPKWLKPLMEAGLYADVLRLTEKSIDLHPWDTSADYDQQQARVQALLATGENERALGEAKSTFNIAPQNRVDRAIDLLGRAIGQSHLAKDPSAVKQFQQEQVAGSAPVDQPQAPDDQSSGSSMVTSIRVDRGQYGERIKALADDHSYESLMGQGNLLLLADRPAEAEAAFVQAAAASGLKGKKLFNSVEGVVKAKRAATGQIGEANAMVTTMRYGAVASRRITMLAPLSIPVEELQNSGRAIPLAALPQTLASAAPSSRQADQALNEFDLAGRFDMACAVLQSANPGDPDLLAWAERVKQSPADVVKSRGELARLLDKSTLDLPTVFEFGRAFYRATDDSQTAAIIYAAAAARAHKLLDPSHPLDQRLVTVRLLLKYRDDFDGPLWDTIYRVPFHPDHDALNARHSVYSDLLDPAYKAEESDGMVRPIMQYDLADCDRLLDRREEALAVLDSIPPAGLNLGMQRSVEWQKALCLYELGRYTEALPYFPPLVEWKGFRQRRDAQWYFASTLAKLGRQAESKKALQDFVDLFGPELWPN
jgi:tetratricopeptide (TPR) repeat protein